MSRRRQRVRNRRRKKPPNRWIIFAQIGLLVGVILFLYLFGDAVVDGATNLVVQLTDKPKSTVEKTSDAGTGGSEGGAQPVLESPPGEESDAGHDS